jgi:hypothetical protein
VLTTSTSNSPFASPGLGDPDGIRSGHPAVVSGVVVDAVKQVTAFLVDGSEFSDGPQLQVYGSGNLIQTLARHNLVDQYRLWVFPLVIGSGKCNIRRVSPGEGNPSWRCGTAAGARCPWPPSNCLLATGD